MYRAIAEQVVGNRVFSNGKWLTCIGNKPVSVGDLIYTDGRCVYGFYQESQQPLVITSPNETIPILANVNGSKATYFYVLKFPSLKLIPLATTLNLPISLHMLTMANGTFYTPKWNNLALYNCNLDAQNNLYEICCYRLSDDDFNKYIQISIRKNGSVIETKTFENLRRNPYSESAYAEYVSFASIENENNWVVIIFNKEWGGIKLNEPDNSNDPYDTVISLQETDLDTYLITPTETIRITTETESITNYKGYGDGVLPDIRITQSFNSPTSVKIPAHDGYYFIINDFYEIPTGYYDDDHQTDDSIWDISINVPPISNPHMNVTIYNSNQQELLTADFPLFADFTIYKNKVLSFRLYPYARGDNRESKAYSPGLYYMTGNNENPLKPLLVQDKYDNGSYAELFNFNERWNIYNANFKAIKNYNNWFTRIKDQEVS